MASGKRVIIPPTDLTGKTIGYWYVNGPAPPRTDSRGHPSIKMWNCTCKCGVRKEVRDIELRRNGSLSCGCFNVEVSSTHHASDSRLYEIWHGMKQRCNNPVSKDAAKYHDRGIRVCNEWNNSFEDFQRWALQNGYSETLTLDRIDVNGNYCPSNCRWATQSQQARNTRFNHFLEFNGKRQTIADWADEIGFDYYTLAKRIEKGWTTERALTQPVDRNKNKYKGEKFYGNSVTES